MTVSEKANKNRKINMRHVRCERSRTESKKKILYILAVYYENTFTQEIIYRSISLKIGPFL